MPFFCVVKPLNSFGYSQILRLEKEQNYYVNYVNLISQQALNGHNYLKKQFDLEGKKCTMKDNSFTKVEDLGMLDDLVTNFQPSIALGRIGHWMDIFFKSWPSISYRGGLP